MFRLSAAGRSLKLVVGRRCSTTPPRVRPTGNLHLGGLRTALYNFLYARQHPEGKFVLRIEDTDQTRFKEDAEEDILSSLAWAGLDYDEGPKKEGPYGPYTQSHRTKLYQEHAQKLLETGHAYKCFCSADRLTEMRLTFAKKGLGSFYDRHCLSLSLNKKAWRKEDQEDYGKTEEEEREEAEEYKDKPYTIRLKVPEGETTIKDIVLGDIAFKNSFVDDQVLLKSDGFPTYHLANVVDDHFMKITHVIRGEEWLNSTPKHQILYESFGWETPKFVHLPLLLNPDKTKLSKRKGHVSVKHYIEAGYLPTAVVNFVALLGWSPSNDNQQIFYNMEELLQKFSLTGINKSGAIVDMQKLMFINSKHMQKMLEEEPQALCKLVKKGFDTYKANGYRNDNNNNNNNDNSKDNNNSVNTTENTTDNNEEEDYEVEKEESRSNQENVVNSEFNPGRELEISDDYLLSVLYATKDHFTIINDLFVNFNYLFFAPTWETPDSVAFRDVVKDLCLTKEKKAISEVGSVFLNTVEKLMAELTGDGSATDTLQERLQAQTKKIAGVINQAAKESKVDKKVAFFLLRYCLTGREKGMEVPLVIAVLGPAETHKRFEAGLRSLE